MKNRRKLNENSGADVNMQDSGGLTPLHSTCFLGYPEFALLLSTAKGANGEFFHKFPLFLYLIDYKQKHVTLCIKFSESSSSKKRLRRRYVFLMIRG